MNVVVFCIDTLRKDHLPTFGYDRETAPGIDDFAGEATLFHDAVAPSTSTFSVASSLLSGLHPEAHGALSFEDRLARGITTVPELLAEGDGATGAFAGVNYFSPAWGLDRFQHSYAPTDEEDPGTAERLVSEFFEWWDDAEGDRYSVVWSFDLQAPFEETADLFYGHANPAVDPYDNALRYVDGQFARLVDGLRERGDYEDTALVLVAGHGEVFDEHHRVESSGLARQVYDWNVPLLKEVLHEDRLGHADVPPYETAIQVPMLVKFPGQTDRRDVLAPCQTHDLAPTAGSLLDLSEPADHWQGHDLTVFAPEGPDQPRVGTVSPDGGTEIDAVGDESDDGEGDDHDESEANRGEAGDDPDSTEEEADPDSAGAGATDAEAEPAPPRWREHTYVTTNQTPGGSTYRAIRGDGRKAVTVTDPSREYDGLAFYLGRRFLSRSRQAFEVGPGFGEERRVATDDAFEDLFDRLSTHVEDNLRVRGRLAERRRDMSDEKRRQLEEMGYL